MDSTLRDWAWRVDDNVVLIDGQAMITNSKF